MNINYEFIKKNKDYINGIFYVYNPTLFLLTSCNFSITNIDIDSRRRRSVVFQKWEIKTFEDDIASLKEYLKTSKEKKLIILCWYDTSDHPDKLEKDIKNGISKRVLEYFKIKI